MADKFIANLRLDMSELQNDINKVNKILKGLGSGLDFDVSKSITNAIKQQLKTLADEATKAGKEMQKATDSVDTSKPTSAVDKLIEKYKDLSALHKAAAKGLDVSGNIDTIKAEIAQIEKDNDSINNNIRVFKAAEEAKRQEVLATAKIVEQSQKDSQSKQANSISEAIKIYQRYYDYLAKSNKAYANGDKNTGVFFEEKAAEEKKAIDSLDESLRENARLREEVAKIVERYQNSNISAADKDEQAQVDAVIRKYKEYINFKIQAAKEKIGGNDAGAESLSLQADKAYQEFVQLNSVMNDNAEVTKAVAEEDDRLSQSLRNLTTGANETESIKNQKDLVEQAAEAYRKYTQFKIDAAKAKAGGKEDSAASLSLQADKAYESFVRLNTALGENEDIARVVAKEDDKLSQSLREISTGASDNKAIKEQKDLLKDTSDKYREYINLKIEARKAEAKGDTETADTLEIRARKAYRAYVELNEKLGENAQLTKTVTEENERLHQVTMTIASQKRDKDDHKKEADEIQNVINKYKEYAEYKAKAAQSAANGDKDDAEYFAEKAQKAKEAYDQFNDTLKQNEKVVKAVAEADRRLADAEQTSDTKAKNKAKEEEANKIKDLASKYAELYNIEAKLHNAKLGQNETDELNRQHAALLNIINDESRYTQEERAAAQAADNVVKAKQQEAQAAARAADEELKHAQNAQATEQAVSRVVQYLKMMIVMRGLRELWQNAKEYATEYYDSLNEIQVVTLKSDAQIEQLTGKYQQMAKQLSVTSTEVADAAVLFYRQGLSDSEVDQRLKTTTMFAKTAAIDVSDAAEMITATMNSMENDIQGNIQRVTDVFLYLGDNAATSAEEVATAMQKASATAGTYGMSFEWLASYIATVSETTRQAAEVVGTSFNSIIARLHNIKQKGFNEEDATKINDVAKALANVDIELLNSDGSWRDMSDIFEDIAAQWGTMDDKMRSYIATTLAGTRQQNTFIALMNDMSKGIEGGSRVFELYEGAMDAAGTTMEKYSIWEESIEAANNRMTASFEKLYSLVLNGDTLKGLYNTIANVVTVFNKGTEALNGWNVTFPLIVGGVLSLIKALGKLEASGGFKALFTAHPYAVIIAGVMAVISALSGLAGAFESAEERYQKYSDSLDHANEMIQRYSGFQQTLSKAQEEGSISARDLVDSTGKYADMLSEVYAICPTVKNVIDQLRDGYISEKEAIDGINEALQEQINNQKILAASSLMGKYADWTPAQGNENGLSLDELSFMKRWEGDTPAKRLKYAYDMEKQYDAATYDYQNNLFNEIFKWTPKDSYIGPTIMKAIEEELKYYDGKNIDADTMWSNIWDSIVAQFNISNAGEISDDVKGQIDGIINEVISVLYNDSNDIEKSYLHDYMYNMIVGDDNILSDEEQKNIGNVISKIVSDAMFSKFDVGISGQDYLGYLVSQIFGTDSWLGWFSEDSDEYVSSVRAAIEEMIAAGMSNADIRKALDQYDDMYDWDGVVDDIKERIIERFNAAMTESHSDVEIQYPDFLGDISLASYNLMDALMESGIDVSKINDIFISATGPEDFAKRLSILASETGVVADEMEEAVDATKLFDAAISSISDASDFITGVKNGGKSFAEMMKMAQDMADASKTDVFASWIDFMTFGEDGMQWSADAAERYSKAMIDAYIEQANLGDNAEDVRQALYDLVGAEQAVEEKTQAFADKMKNASSSIKSLADARDAIMNSEAGSISTEDLTSMLDKYPKLMAYIGDADAMSAKIGEIIQEEAASMLDSYKEYARTSEDLAKNSPFADMLTEDTKTLNGLMQSVGEGSPIYAQISQYIDMIASSSMGATGELENLNKEILALMMNNAFNNSNVNLTNRPVVDANKLAGSGWSNVGEGTATVFTQSYGAGNKVGADWHWNQNVVLDVTPILPNGDVLSPEDLESYLERLIGMSGSVDELYQNDEQGILIDVQAVSDDESWDEAYGRIGTMMEWLYKLQEAYYGVSAAEDDALGKLAEQMSEQAENNWAETTGYADQLKQIEDAFNSGGIDAAVEKFNGLNETIRNGIANEYPELVKALDKARDAEKEFGKESEDTAKASKKLDKELKDSQKNLKSKYWKDTAKAAKELKNGTISVTDAYDKFNKECDQVVKAYEDMTDVQSKMNKGTEVTVSDVSNLEKVLGKSADWILDNWDDIPAMMDEIIAESESATSALNDLNEAAFIRITGTSAVDFSDLQNGLVTVQGMAQDTINALIATGQFALETKDLNQSGWVWTNGIPHFEELHGTYQVLKPVGNNPFKGGGSSSNSSGKKSGGGGGGGGGNKSKAGMTEVEIALDKMSQIKDFQDNAQSIYKNRQSYYEQTGQLQGVIKYMELEQKELEIQKKTLEDNIGVIETYMEAKKQELATLAVGTDKYEEVADDLDKLQNAHQDYTNQVIENATAIDELNDSIKEQHDAIRQMEIDLRELIYGAIEDRENKAQEMLESEIDMQNEILDIIKARYEKERDLTLELADQRIEALEEEKDLIEQELDLRKKQAEEEDKITKLNALEAKYARISADPTRQKEALSIYEEISELRDEIAWDTAEKEAEAQQKAIDDQIESIEDYKEYVEDYYEDLFKHPKKLIAEMKDIMSKSDEEIIAWLEANNEEFEASTAETQESMIKGWQDTLDAMRGKIKTYWDEVETIIAQGDDYIIQFLKDNKADYAEAGKLQAEAYVDEWKKQLDDLKKAYQEVSTVAASTYSYIVPNDSVAGSSSSGGGGGGGGGGSGGGGGNTSSKVLEAAKAAIGKGVVTDSAISSAISSVTSKVASVTKEKHGYEFWIGKNRYAANTYNSKAEAKEAAEAKLNKLKKKDIEDLKSKYSGLPVTYASKYSALIKQYKDLKKSGLGVYESGGLAYHTGPAWLDGTLSKPERVLSPKQTELFEQMVASLEQVARVNIPSMPNIGEYMSGKDGGYVIENITVNVDNLDTDDDYDELAEKVGEALMNKMSRGTVVGGIRTGR